MKKYIILVTIILMFQGLAKAQTYSPNGKEFGFGIMVGDPLGGTLKFWTQRDNAFVVDVGSSYFGSPRIGVDYLWHFNAFNSPIANLYAGPGGVLGIGEGNGFYFKDKFYRSSGSVGLAARGVMGVNVTPRNTPVEAFFELGVLLALTPEVDSGFDVGLGVRFYP